MKAEISGDETNVGTHSKKVESLRNLTEDWDCGHEMVGTDELAENSRLDYLQIVARARLERGHSFYGWSKSNKVLDIEDL